MVFVAITKEEDHGSIVTEHYMNGLDMIAELLCLCSVELCVRIFLRLGSNTRFMLMIKLGDPVLMINYHTIIRLILSQVLWIHA